uniref:Uncharacterized protein n=1 Tax=Podoviridae sp. ctUS21 TaxID=2826557 RepID=A0A8S5MQE0_9CAUD|nr:MAG TPA: hypothetical protein [Podoviridae sp. ctUS21]
MPFVCAFLLFFEGCFLIFWKFFRFSWFWAVYEASPFTLSHLGIVDPPPDR